jgi:hypothetical protein
MQNQTINKNNKFIGSDGQFYTGLSLILIGIAVLIKLGQGIWGNPMPSISTILFISIPSLLILFGSVIIISQYRTKNQN